MDDKTLWNRCVAFHGHECGGLTIGYKAALYAIDLLGITFSPDEQLVCISENDACGVDAIILNQRHRNPEELPQDSGAVHIGGFIKVAGNGLQTGKDAYGKKRDAAPGICNDQCHHRHIFIGKPGEFGIQNSYFGKEVIDNADAFIEHKAPHDRN